MPKEEQNEWMPDASGGLPEKFRYGPITKARFGFDEKIGNGELACLFLYGPAKDVEPEGIEIEDPDEYRVVLTIGKGWDTPDGGKSVENDKGKTRPPAIFGLGKFLGRMGAPVSEGGLGLADELPRVGSWRKASTWMDAEFYVERVYEPKKKPEDRQFSALVPARVITFGDISNVGADLPEGSGSADEEEDEKPAKTKAKSSAFDVDEWLGELDEDVAKALKKKAKKSDSADDFADAAAEIDDISKAVLKTVVENSKAIFKELGE